MANIQIGSQVVNSSLKGIDAAIASIESTQIPAIPGNNINNDYAKLKTDANVWPQTLKSQLTQVLNQLDQSIDQFKANEPSIATADRNTQVNQVKAIQSQFTTISNAIQSVNNDVDAFYQNIGNDNSLVKADYQNIVNQVNSLQTQAGNLEQKIQAQQKKIEYYKKNPWKLILDGLTIIGLIDDLNDLISNSKAIDKEIDSIKSIEAQLNVLNQVTGPVANLVTYSNNLGLGLVSLHTNIAESINTLTQLQDLTIAPAIVAADLSTLLQELTDLETSTGQLLNS